MDTRNSIDRTHLFRIFAGRQIAQISRVERAGGVLEDPKTVYLHDDHIGTTSLITDSTGAVIETRNYGSFGDETAAIDYAATGVLSGFTSQEHDADLGLINMRGRLYDPRLGRFTTSDPFVTRLSPQGFNRYSYVRNNPLRLVGPSGFDPICSYPGACGGQDQEEQAREEGIAQGEAEAQAASNAAAAAVAGEHQCDSGACNGQAPSTLTDPTTNPGAQASRDAALNWTAGNRGSASGIPPIQAGPNPFRGPLFAGGGAEEDNEEEVGEVPPEEVLAPEREPPGGNPTALPPGVLFQPLNGAPATTLDDPPLDSADPGIGCRVPPLGVPVLGPRATLLYDVPVESFGNLVGRGTVDLRATLEAIDSGALSPRDSFRNREGLLPVKPDDYYLEFLHPTPGVSGAGPQRIVQGSAGELYYTPNHYQLFIPLN